MLLTEYPQDQVEAAVDLCVRWRVFSRDAVLNVRRNELLASRVQLDLSDRPHWVSQGAGSRSASLYDQLKAVPAAMSADRQDRQIAEEVCI